jgi:hypothetical protein
MQITTGQLNNIIKEKFGEIWRVSYFSAYVTFRFVGEEYFNNKLEAETAANAFKKQLSNCCAVVDKVEFDEVDIVIKAPNPHKGVCL